MRMPHSIIPGGNSFAHVSKLLGNPSMSKRVALITGVTLITHGYGGVITDWIGAMAVAIARADKERVLVSLQNEGSRSEEKLAELEEKAKRLEHLLDVLSRQNGTAAAATDIRTVQGALAWPVQGKIIEHFGKQRNAKFSTVTFSNGLKIAAAPGAEVRSVFAGTVLFSQWFKGYGNLVILDHGNRVFSLYGNLKSPAVTLGDRVGAGQALAGVGESEDAHSGYLYFEIRQDNKPEDPQKWLR